MGIVVPRPQMRSLERRTIEKRLRAYNEAIAAGKPREEAMCLAKAITKRTVQNEDRRNRKCDAATGPARQGAKSAN